MSSNTPFSEYWQKTENIFKSLPKESINRLEEVKICREYEKGDFIFEEASSAKGVYYIAKGKVKVSQLGVDGKYQILHLSKDGDVMGYRAVLSDDLFSCSAIAMEKSHICFIPKDTFIDLVANNSKLALSIIHLFSDELKKIESNLTKITQRPVKDRVAQALISLKNKYGFKEDGKTINVIIKRQEIANMAGSTRETITRVLYHYQEIGIIKLDGKAIQIIDEKAIFDLGNLLE
jgi:CRP/FNR family transcriptional regulator, polysaccharide utilization system transcription regulator